MAGELSNIDALEQKLGREPGSKFVLEELLSAYLTEESWSAPRRFEIILEYVRLFPRDLIARTPYVAVDLEESPAAWRSVEQQRLRHVAEHPSDCEIARGFALFLAESDAQRALDVLRAVERDHPGDPELLTDMGRISQDPAARLNLFLRARRAGASQPNLLVWIARAALDAREVDLAERSGRELLDLAAQARTRHQHRVDWRERGGDLWNKAMTDCGDRATAGEVVNEIGAHAYRKHWGHTVCGVLAAQRGDISSALEHLLHSGDVPGDPRLSSYGPSFRLAKELLEMGHWDAVASYLEACRLFWDSPVLETWMDDITHRRVPDFRDQ